MLNRAVGRARILAKQRDFEAFEEVIAQAKERLPMRVLAWCGGGPVFGIASTATKRGCWTPVPCRCRDVGDNMCSVRRWKQSWKRCGVP